MTQVWTPMILSSNGGEWLPVELDDPSEVVPLFKEGQDYKIGTVRLRLFDLIDPVLDAVLNLHTKEPMSEGQIIGPYCSHCISPIDGGPELYPCKTVRTVMAAVGIKTPDCTCDWETIANWYSGEVLREVRTHPDEGCPDHS